MMRTNKNISAILILLLQLTSCERTEISSAVVTIKLNAIAIVLNVGGNLSNGCCYSTS